MAERSARTQNRKYVTNTIYISADTELTKPPVEKYKLVDECLVKFFFEMNRFLYNKLYEENKKTGWNTNHLFISLKLAWESNAQGTSTASEHLSTEKLFILRCDNSSGCEKPLANFASHGCNGRQDEEVKMGSTKWSVKYIKNEKRYDEMKPYERPTYLDLKHSECSVFYYFKAILECIKKCIDDPKETGSLKVVQLGLHSFLDFCEKCNELVYDMHKHLQTELSASLPEGGRSTVCLIGGFNNRCYYTEKLQSIYFNSTDGTKLEVKGGSCPDKIPAFGYFLTEGEYKPYVGEWQEEEQTAPLFIHLHEPVNIAQVPTTTKDSTLSDVDQLSSAMSEMKLSGETNSAQGAQAGDTESVASGQKFSFGLVRKITQ